MNVGLTKIRFVWSSPAAGFVPGRARRISQKLSRQSVGTVQVTFSGGQCIDEASGKSVSFAEMAVAAHHAKKLPPDTQPGLVATHFWEPPNFTFPFGAHIVVTEVDRDTGDIQIRRYVCVDDCGRIINPLIVDGQPGARETSETDVNHPTPEPRPQPPTHHANG